MTDLERVIDFTHQNTNIQIVLEELDSAEFCMWSGISLRASVLYVDESLAHIGDLLHEIGHLVTIPKELRCYAFGNLDEDDSEHPYYEKQSEWYRNILSQGEYREDEKEYQQALHISDDDAATFWAYMACKEIGLDPMLPFENGFEWPSGGDEKYESVDLAYEAGNYSSCSTQAYYAGLLESKTAKTMKTWDVTK
jgi:hypothetical protein